MFLSSGEQTRQIRVATFGAPRLCKDQDCVNAYNDGGIAQTELIVATCQIGLVRRHDLVDDLYDVVPRWFLRTEKPRYFAVVDPDGSDIACHKQYSRAVAAQNNAVVCAADACAPGRWSPPGQLDRCRACPNDCGIGRVRKGCYGKSIGTCDQCPPPPLHAHLVPKSSNCTWSCDDGYTSNADQCTSC